MARPKKVIVFKLSSFKNRGGTKSWRVTGTKPDGTRVRQNYSDKSEAVQAMADLEADAAGRPEHRRALRTSLTVEQLADAEAAIQHWGGDGISKVVAHYKALERRALAKGASLDDAFAFFEARFRSETKAISILNARTEFLASRIGIEESTRQNYEGSLKLLLKPDPNKHVHAVRVSDLEKILSRFTNISSRRSHRRIFSIFFNWCVRHHYCMEDPCKRLDKLPKDTSKIAILSFDEVKRLLSAALRYQDGATAAAVAISLFGGLRPSEVADLKEEDITAERIRVTGGKLRRTLKRSVPIPPVLAAWLKLYPFKGLPAGWNYKLKVLKAATGAKRWVPDIIRHTSITFQAERDKDEGLTAFNCGTSKAMIDRHYRNTVDDLKLIDQFWKLSPDVIQADKKLRVTLPVQERATWPSKAELSRLVWSKPMMHAAKEIGVSDVALKKRCVRLGVQLPKRGQWISRSKENCS
ncbi:hypothetical protein OKA04_18230 [Luteolibacter flavescens]|uniref:Core-binding (CB) domain-containing protein n=1 Tax=Luteolibacter flavescens TaxID=1859460 RepID=A0ABT3FT14_9BACT|nr:hypothetical protein [Luteolibacter flavescens]MCW1886682.1 hypothetical protein [Luteolibacter flavescens]